MPSLLSVFVVVDSVEVVPFVSTLIVTPPPAFPIDVVLSVLVARPETELLKVPVTEVVKDETVRVGVVVVAALRLVVLVVVVPVVSMSVLVVVLVDVAVVVFVVVDVVVRAEEKVQSVKAEYPCDKLTRSTTSRGTNRISHRMAV